MDEYYKSTLGDACQMPIHLTLMYSVNPLEYLPKNGFILLIFKGHNGDRKKGNFQEESCRKAHESSFASTRKKSNSMPFHSEDDLIEVCGVGIPIAIKIVSFKIQTFVFA